MSNQSNLTTRPCGRVKWLVRLLRFWWKGRIIKTPWWSDTLTIVWTLRAVPLTTVNKFIVETDKRKRGFVVRRESVWLTEPVYHDLNWYRQFMKRIRKCKSNNSTTQSSKV